MCLNRQMVNMPIYLLCLTTNGGLPILTRKRGDCDNLPFSTVASLNGFHMFFKSLGVILHTTITADWTYVWKDFYNAITLIVCSRTMGEQSLLKLAEFVFGVFALFLSRDELSQQALSERIKREAKNYVPIIDVLLESKTLLLGYTESIVSVENASVLQRLNDFSNQCGSLFCSIVVDCRIMVATEGWWDLNVLDRELLVLMLNSSKTLQNDVPVYLPKKSPNVAYRFVTIPLSSNVVLCVICGSKPLYRELHVMASNIFRSDATIFRGVDRCVPRSLPEYLETDSSILEMLFLNIHTHKCVFLPNTQSSNEKRNLNSSQRLDMLQRFFERELKSTKLLMDKSQKTSCTEAEIVDMYWCSDYHKCYAISDDLGNILLMLFMPSVPTHSMRFLGEKVHKSISAEKSICW